MTIIKNASAATRSRALTRTNRRSVVPAPVVAPGSRTTDLVSDLTGVALVPPPHVIRKGFPFAPLLSVTCTAAVSADGSYIPERTYPWESSYVEAHTRFIAQSNTWDDIAAKWIPFFSSGVDYYFTWTSTVEPRMEEIEYRVGKLRYPVDTIRITEEASLVSSFNNGFDDAASFMISIAGIINSSESASLMRVGDTPADSIEVRVDEFFHIQNQYGTAVLKTPVHPAKMIPFYMVLINDPSRTELNVAVGTSQIYRANIPNQDATRSLKVFIGEDLAGDKTLDLNLFEITLFPYAYGGAMSAEQIITAMADVYGSSS